jgi:hypothetical protein
MHSTPNEGRRGIVFAWIVRATSVRRMTARVAHQDTNALSEGVELVGQRRARAGAQGAETTPPGPCSGRARLSRALQLATGLAVVMARAPGWAGEPERLELEYVADAACPDRQAFEQLVHTQLAESGDAPVTSRARVIVEFRRTAAGVVGRFQLARRDGSRSSRELESASCDEAATALAFVLALALSGRASSDADFAPSQPPVLATTPAAPVAERRHPGTDSVPSQVGSSWRWRFGLGVQLGARSGVGPVFTPVEAAVLSVRATKRHPWELGLRVALLRGQPITHSDAAGDSTFEWLAGRVEGCFWSARLSRAFSATPCFSSHVGQLTVVGAPEPLPGARGRRAAGLWLEAGGALRLQLQLVKALSVEIQGEALLPVTRYRFAFNPDTDVYRVPPVAAYGSFGLVAHFP